ncbi:MAG: DUF4160 domain-containing protein [Magnetococcus sp. DMHC-1]|nr:DUF4160 domain-containing protein [Magnetococcales bacterium]
MTTIAQLGNIKISVYADDHPPPHFHVTSPDADAIVRIRDMVVMGCDGLHADIKVAMKWAKHHREKILLTWIYMNG